MNYSSLKTKVKEFAYQNGIDKIGFTDAEPLYQGDPRKRANPKAHLPQASSVVSIAVAYPWEEIYYVEDGPARGRFSFIARGTDYHQVVSGRMENLKRYMLSIIPDAMIITMTDKGELLEKAVAVKAGLGWFGRNTLLVTPEYGSWVCLGELITDIPFPPDPLITNDCEDCRSCIDACPTKALDEDKNLNPGRCLAGLSQSKQPLNTEIQGLMGNTLYGCDICQLACPVNRKSKFVKHPEFYCLPDVAYPILIDFLSMNKEDYKKRYGNTSAAWRGHTVLMRNAVIAAANLKDTSVKPQLHDILSKESSVVLKKTAQWALDILKK
jgi:epoxyqueuosine reductase